jgi:vanillate O-demethylase ferredoxin subunit
MHGTIAVDAGVTAAQLLTVQVAEVRAEARDVMTLELRAPNGGSLPPFEPGAHLDLHLPNGLVRQ